MSDTELVPCPEWAEKLADLHARTLSPPDQAALEAHLSLCQACSEVLLEYQRMDEQIHQTLRVKPLPSFTPELLRAREALSDEWLVSCAQRGEQEDFILLFNKYYGPMQGKHFERRLYELASSMAIDHMRRMAERQIFPPPIEALLDAADRPEPLLSIVHQLPRRIRICFTLYMEGHEYHEIAQALNLKERTVKMYLHEAHKWVCEALGYSNG